MDRILRCLPAPPGPITTTTGALPLPAAFEPATYSSDRRVHNTALPEDIQRQIVSKLPMKEAGRTTVLSSSWRYIWRSTPLDLDANSLVLRGGRYEPDEDRKMVSRVSQVIASHDGPFRSVHLNSKAMRHRTSKLREWFQAFASKGVQDLVFVNRWSSSSSAFLKRSCGAPPWCASTLPCATSRTPAGTTSGSPSCWSSACAPRACAR
ncbi:hypothetical protein ZWY2020_045800 [Hordeum vulgare]|nr:hypothetical protein ZWY2020_045800 [Hordeum vulgare]